ncbi:transcriptional regulator [Enterobacterales bacterium]|nr:transcriptional regulator [Enterobacterales bacterium]
MEDLAEKINMAPSTFHKHFKEVTTLSPLQYQKHLRLCEAQRLMLADPYSASQAAFAVGYESSNQFSREYKRLFGDTPKNSITHSLSLYPVVNTIR